ncbi:MAG: hypothetical protein IPL70_16005 [Uliginosibacterium sp.]|nr:hypothetical protein [Uliginosibacterium sp.]
MRQHSIARRDRAFPAASFWAARSPGSSRSNAIQHPFCLVLLECLHFIRKAFDAVSRGDIPVTGTPGRSAHQESLHAEDDFRDARARRWLN